MSIRSLRPSPQLKKYARRMRKRPTFWERRMRWKLREWGYRFQFQVPMLGYIPDFVLSRERVILEVDGMQHYETKAERYDAARTALLQTQDYRVVRIPNTLVSELTKEDLDWMIARTQKPVSTSVKTTPGKVGFVGKIPGL